MQGVTIFNNYNNSLKPRATPDISSCQTHNFLCTSDQVIENIGNCKQFRLVSDFLFKSHGSWYIY